MLWSHEDKFQYLLVGEHLNNIKMENWKKKTKILDISLRTFVFTVLPLKNILIWTEFSEVPVLVLKKQFF